MSEQVKTFSDISRKNIYDFSHTGGSKTKRAIEYIEHEISNKRPVIVIMQDYATLDAAYVKRFSAPVLSRSLIVKGKTQSGMCIHGERYSKLYEFVSPINECKGCPEKATCAYQAQKKELKELLDSSSNGFVILTTPRMLDHILIQSKDLKPTIIIDDVPLSQVFTNEISDNENNLKRLVKECDELTCEKLSSLAKMLLDKTPTSEVVGYIQENKEAIIEEKFRSQVLINGMYSEGQTFASYDSLYGLCDAISCDSTVDVFYDKYGIFLDSESKSSALLIVSTKKNLQQYRIFYLNASSNYIDEYYINQLDDLEQIGKESEDNPQFTIFQLVDAKYSRSSIKDSPVIVEKVITICNLFKQALIDLGIAIPFFTHDKSYEEKFKPSRVFQQLPHTFVKFYGKGTKGTNEFLNIPISVIVGTPFLPPSYFMHPAFMAAYRSDEEIATDVIEAKKNKAAGLYAPPVYPVNSSITERCAIEQLIQVIGRTLRVDPNNPEQEKFVILFSMLDNQEAFEKECKRQNGAKVSTFHYDQELDRNRFFQTLGKSTSSVFRPIMNAWIFKKLDEELAREPSVKLGEFSKKMAEVFHQPRLYKSIERMIEGEYHTEIQSIGVRGKGIRVVLKRKMSD